MNIEDIWTNLNQSELYAQAMLDGGTNEEDILLALNDPDLPLKIEETIDVIHHFRQITQKRWSSQFTSGIGSDLDQRFDLAFLTFNLSADNVETALKKMIAEDLKAFKLTQGLLIVVILILGFVISGLLLRDNARKIESIYALKLIKEDAHSSQNQLQNVINGAKLGYWDWSYKTGVHIVNDEWLSILGLSREKITNHINDWEGSYSSK